MAVRRVAQGAGVLLGLALLAAAVVYALRGVDWAVLADAPVGGFVLLVAAVGANLVLTGMLFWAITCSFDTRPGVGAMRMVALINISALLNYLPLPRAGMVGRSAYLKWRHGLPLRQSAMILAAVLVMAMLVTGVATAALLALGGGAAGWWAMVGALVVLSLVVGPVARRVLRRPIRAGWLWVVLRAADLLMTSLRLWLAFVLLGQPIGFEQAVLIGSGSLLVKLAGVTPSGLGLSEWLVAALTPVLAPVETAEAAAAALLDRAAEVAVTLPAGLVSLVALRRRDAAAGAAASEARSV